MEPIVYQIVDEEEVALPNPDWVKKSRKSKYKFYLKRSQIPVDYWDIEFEDYKGSHSVKAYKAALEYSQNCHNLLYHNVNLYLVGNNSSQKTMVACNIGKHFIMECFHVLFVQAGDLIDLLMKNQGFSFEKELYEQIEKYKQCDLLIIDDIFDSKKAMMWRSESKDLIVAEWDRFLRNRISNDKKIILTSNVLLESIFNDFGKSLYELLDRNFVQLHFKDSIKIERKGRFKGILGDT